MPKEGVPIPSCKIWLHLGTHISLSTASIVPLHTTTCTTCLMLVQVTKRCTISEAVTRILSMLSYYRPLLWNFSSYTHTLQQLHSLFRKLQQSSLILPLVGISISIPKREASWAQKVMSTWQAPNVVPHTILARMATITSLVSFLVFNRTRPT